MVIALSEHLNSCRRGGKHMIFQKGVRGSVDVKYGSRKMDQIYSIYSMYCTLFSSYEKAQCQGKIMRNIQYSTIRFSIQLIYLLYDIFFWCPLNTETAIFADHFVILFAQKWGNLYCCKSEMMYGTVFSLTFVSQTFSVRTPNVQSIR